MIAVAKRSGWVTRELRPAWRREQFASMSLIGLSDLYASRVPEAADLAVEPEDFDAPIAPPSSAVSRPAVQWVAPLCCVVTAALLVSLLAPPSKLVAFIGSDIWSRLGLGLVVFVAVYSVS